MDSLAMQGTRRAVETALEHLPKELDETYNDAMKRIDNQNNYDRQLSYKILSWMTFSRRPLSLRELQHALAVEKSDTKFDEKNVPDQDMLTSVCAGLVTIDQERSVFRLIHYTTQEYFQRVGKIRFPTAEKEISAYLSYLPVI